MKAGDLVRIYDPDESQLDGRSYSAIGLLVSIGYKSSNPESYRIFNIYLDGSISWFDEPYWAAETVSPALTD
jgi:hypothetical protein